MPNSPDPPFTEDEAESLGPTENFDSEHPISPETTIQELRRIFGPHLAPGYEDQDTMGELLSNGGYANFDEYLARHHTPPTSPQDER